MIAVFSLGIVEIFILITMAGLLLIVPVVLGIALVKMSKRPPNPDTNPNVAPCPHCNELVSIHAPTCPRCGRPLKSA